MDFLESGLGPLEFVAEQGEIELIDTKLVAGDGGWLVDVEFLGNESGLSSVSLGYVTLSWRFLDVFVGIAIGLVGLPVIDILFTQAATVAISVVFSPAKTDDENATKRHEKIQKTRM